jgi:hypothetical protein
MLVPPADWRTNNGDSWGSALAGSLAPTEQSELGAGPGDSQQGSSDAKVAIVNPSNGKTVKGSVQILGRAAVDGFKQYKLEFGEGPNPDSWTTIITVPLARELGVLGVWDTSNLEPGGYTLRLTVTDKDDKDYVSTVVVSVDN